MADVDMPDADVGAGSSKGKVAGKSAKITVPEAMGEGKKRFEVKKVKSSALRDPIYDANRYEWNAVALWAWDIVVDNCAICRNHTMDLCTTLRVLQGSLR